MMVYGYARISSKDQNPDRQLDALIMKGVQRKNIYLDRLSGKSFNRPSYKKMLQKVNRGDLIVITSIDRLGRNYAEILNQWRLITKEKGVNIEVLDMPLLNTSIEQDGLTGVFVADLVLQILAYVAETERNYIKKRQSEGIVSAKKRGIKFGRPKIEASYMFSTAYKAWIEGKISSREAAVQAGMSHTTFYRRCKELEM